MRSMGRPELARTNDAQESRGRRVVEESRRKRFDGGLEREVRDLRKRLSHDVVEWRR